MRRSSHIWVDGSLRDYVWYTTLIDEVRSRHSQYRIAIIYVRCSAPELVRRIKRRGEQTGRWIPEDSAIKSLQQTEKAMKVLGPQADLVAVVDNEEETPHLEVVHHQSQSFSFLKRVLDIAPEADFPNSLRALTVARDPILTEVLEFSPNVRESLHTSGAKMQAMPLTEIWRPLLLRFLGPRVRETSLLVSPAARVNLDLHSRRNANIPDSAAFFSVSHGACDAHGRLFVPSCFEDIPQEVVPLLQCMCFIYMDGNGSVVAVNVLTNDRAVGRRHFLRCDAPERLSVQLDLSLLRDSRWHPRVPLERVAGRASAIAWLLPGELKECPFGAFAFQLPGHRPSIYFPISAS